MEAASQKNVIILHGWGNGSKSYAALADDLREKGCRVYLFDLPGFGVARQPSEPWSVDDYADHVKKFCDAEGLSKIFLLGHSFGGRIGIRFAIRYPDRLAGLILYAAAGIKPKPSVKNSFLFVVAKMGSWIFNLPGLDHPKELAKKILYRAAGTRDYANTTGVMRETMKKVIAEDLVPSLPLVHVPTFIVWGENDKSTPVEDAYIMHDAIEGSELRIIPGATHISLHKEEPQTLASLAFQFISHH